MKFSTNDIYNVVLKSYPDVMNVRQVSEILDVSTKTVYKQLKNGDLQYIKVGREFRIPKIAILKYFKIINNSED